MVFAFFTKFFSRPVAQNRTWHQVLDGEAAKIEEEKLRAIGQRNRALVEEVLGAKGIATRGKKL